MGQNQDEKLVINVIQVENLILSLLSIISAIRDRKHIYFLILASYILETLYTNWRTSFRSAYILSYQYLLPLGLGGCCSHQTYSLNDEDPKQILPIRWFSLTYYMVIQIH